MRKSKYEDPAGNGSRILLHCCCGPCSTESIIRLLDAQWKPVLFFGNSNIFPEEENQKRWGELMKVAKLHNLEVIRGQYDHQSWLDFIKGLESCPEHGERCLKCFEFNLRQAHDEANALGIEYFTTTLTVSRFKSSGDIFRTGAQFEGFVPIDFKKKDGFEQSVILSRQMDLYRQQYCGCEFSDLTLK
ncbi:MAG: epoxyqueuosine reductase QueH [Sphaerochaetaceae bacterium]